MSDIVWHHRTFSIIGQHQSKTNRTGKRAIQLAGSAVEGLASAKPPAQPGSLDLALVFLTRLVACHSLIIPASQPKELDGDI
jgi:hypothetical protein